MSPEMAGLVTVLALLLIVGVMVGVDARHRRARALKRAVLLEAERRARRVAALRRRYGITEEDGRG